MYPLAAPEMLASRHCHDNVILCASPTGNYGTVPATNNRCGLQFRIGSPRPYEGLAK